MLVYALVAGVLFGLYFSLVGIGLNLVFGVMRIVNLAHGDCLMLGAFIAFGIATLVGIDPLFAVPLAFVIAEDTWKRLALIAAVLFLVVVELLNTAIEKLADHVTPVRHPGIGRIKDMGSAAVGVALLLAAAVWLVAIAERLAIL